MTIRYLDLTYTADDYNRGRNGYFQVGGLIAHDGTETIHLYAKSSKGESESARIVVTKEAAKALAAWLIEATKQ